MPKLANSISVRGRFARSANLERDIKRSEPLDGYVITARVLDVLDRITETAVTGTAGGAWSLTGPYGSGKSSLALLIDAVFGQNGNIRRSALKLIDDVSERIGNRIRDVHRRHKTETKGFHRGLVTAGRDPGYVIRGLSTTHIDSPRGLVTAGRDPINLTVLCALYSAVLRSYGKDFSSRGFPAATTLQGALEDAQSDDPRRTGSSPSALVDIARCLAKDAPLLLVIDEFGKNLETIGDGGNSDPYILQQLAEAGQGSGLPIFLLTLQHLSFEDHMAGVNSIQCREWAKVQGRFEDIAFVESSGQTRTLIGTVFDVHDPELRARIDQWASIQAQAMRELGIADLADPKTVASCYPLHPLAALVLPELCNRYGQRERTLFSFLAGNHPSSVSSFLTNTDMQAQESLPLPTVGIDVVYDYFVNSSSLYIMSASMSGRWIEVATRLRDSHGLTPQQIHLAKTIALLNLVSMSGTIRASRALLALTCNDSDQVLAELERDGIVTYRDFADEYRIWQGTDININQLMNMARRRVEKQPLFEILNEIDEPRPVIAARHSAQHDVLRVFRRRYADTNEKVEWLDAFSEYDGELLLLVGKRNGLPTTSRPWEQLKPIVVAVPSESALASLDVAAREVAAVQKALGNPLIDDDWVARREMSERLAQTWTVLDQAITDTFRSDSCRWMMLDHTSTDGYRELPGGRGSAALSDAADRAYNRTPRVRNEMLNRAQLTSQGSRARRLLLTAMIEHGTEPDLGMKGYGPEMAMYLAFLKSTGIHSEDRRNSDQRNKVIMTFRKPTKEESLQPAWNMFQSEFKRSIKRRINLRDVHAALRLPPFGMKAGVIPVLVTATLIAFSDEVAIYEHGTFKPVLTPELSERMVCNPNHFDIRHFANTTGVRRRVIDALTRRLGLRPGFYKHRVSNVLTVVGHLVARINRLDNYTRQTRCLKPTTVKARKILMTATEPDELLFNLLPEALGFQPVQADAEEYAQADKYAASVGDLMDQLTSCFDRLLQQQLKYLLQVSAEVSREAVMNQAASLEYEFLDPDIRAFVISLGNDTIQSDTDWINAIATVVSRKAPAEWTDHDVGRFQSELAQQFATFHRLLAIHYDHSAHNGDSASTYRVIVTRNDGIEQARLVSIDQNLRSKAERKLERTLKEFTDLTGSRQRAHHTLLALIGDKLLPSSTHE